MVVVGDENREGKDKQVEMCVGWAMTEEVTGSEQNGCWGEDQSARVG